MEPEVTKLTEDALAERAAELIEAFNAPEELRDPLLRVAETIASASRKPELDLLLTKLLKLGLLHYPRFVPLRLLAAEIAQNRDDPVQALRHSTTALASAPADPRAQRMLAEQLLPLLEADNGSESRPDVARAVRIFLRSEYASVCTRLWQAYTALEPLPEADCQALLEMPRSMTRLWFRIHPLRLVAPDDPVLSELHRESLRWWTAEFLERDVPQPDRRTFVSGYARERTIADDRRLAFQTRMIRDRALVLKDPWTGRWCQIFDAVLTGRMLYSFGDRELSLLVTVGAGHKAGAVILPRIGVMIDLGAEVNRNLAATPFANVLSKLLRRVAEHRRLYADAIGARHESRPPQKVAALFVAAENPAHHLWNSFPGFDRVVDLGLSHHVDEVHISGTEFFGGLTEIFPEFGHAHVVDHERMYERDPYPFSRENTIVPVGGYYIRRKLLDRIAQRMLESLPAETRLRANRLHPIVWIGLRTGSRSWVGQEAEVTRLIDELHRHYPEATVLLDGYSYPVGRDLISRKWAHVIEELSSVARSIQTTVQRRHQVVNLIGNTLGESVQWALTVDAYITPSGTTQHKIGWFSRTPGIVYAPPAFILDPPECRPGAYQVEEQPIPVTVVGTPVARGTTRGPNDRRAYLENIRLDRGELLDALLGLLARRQALGWPRF